jgi:hypothetical protein
MMYAVEVGHWVLPNDQAAQLREFLLREWASLAYRIAMNYFIYDLTH